MTPIAAAVPPPPDDVLETLVDMREYDVPYVIRVAIDQDLRVGAWYSVQAKGSMEVRLEWQKGMLEKVSRHQASRPSGGRQGSGGRLGCGCRVGLILYLHWTWPYHRRSPACWLSTSSVRKRHSSSLMPQWTRCS